MTDARDIVERLREESRQQALCGIKTAQRVCDDAAAEIESLRAEIDRLNLEIAERQAAQRRTEEENVRLAAIVERCSGVTEDGVTVYHGDTVWYLGWYSKSLRREPPYSIWQQEFASHHDSEGLADTVADLESCYSTREAAEVAAKEARP